MDSDDDPAGEDSTEMLSVAEAALRYGLSERKVSQLVRLGELPGARKVRGTHNKVWRIPATAFEAIGLTPQPAPSSSEASTPEVAELHRVVRRLELTLNVERQWRADKERELEDALLRIGRLRGELRREQERREQVETELERVRRG